VSHFNAENLTRANDLVSLYPHRRSAVIPLCHLAQSQDGWLRPEAIEQIADLVGVTAAEVRGSASFYDMLHLEPVGTYLVSVCTNIACLLGGAAELLEHAQARLGVRCGGTTPDGMFSLEEAECLADCDVTPCVTVNHRYVRTTTASALDALFDDLAAGRLSETVPRHGILNRVDRTVGLQADPVRVSEERAEMAHQRAQRAAANGSGTS
jgi:NADH-quinone oxidoreductase subunit E